MKRWFLPFIMGLILLAGCAPRRVVQMGPRSTEADSSFLAINLKLGSDVVVVFHDGTRQGGQLRAIVPEGLVVGKVGNFGLEETLCPYDRIARVEAPPEAGEAGAVAGNILAGMLLGVMTLMTVAVISLKNSGAGCN